MRSIGSCRWISVLPMYWAPAPAGCSATRQVTDAYLLTLAIRAGVRLVTFDGGIGQLLANPAERQQHLRLLDARPHSPR